MKIIWTRRAIVHLLALKDFIAQDSPPSAEKVAKKIIDSVVLLSKHPAIGRPGRIVGTREVVVAGTPYVIPYRVREDQLELLAIFHGRQKWPDEFERFRWFE